VHLEITIVLHHSVSFLGTNFKNDFIAKSAVKHYTVMIRHIPTIITKKVFIHSESCIANCNSKALVTHTHTSLWFCLTGQFLTGPQKSSLDNLWDSWSRKFLHGTEGHYVTITSTEKLAGKTKAKWECTCYQVKHSWYQRVITLMFSMLRLLEELKDGWEVFRSIASITHESI